MLKVFPACLRMVRAGAVARFWGNPRGRRWALLIGFALAAVGVGTAAAAAGHSDAQARRASAPGRVSTPLTRQLSRYPRCFGAASMNPAQPCHNRTLRSEVVPIPQLGRHAQNFPCTVAALDGALKVCTFGVSPTVATGTVALLGDSHAGNWRAAIQVVAEAKRWEGVSFSLGGCPYSTATRVIPEPLRSHCIERNRQAPAWFAQHPDVHVVFVAEISGTPWLVPRGQNAFQAEVRDYMAAWSALPPSVQHIIVIRDTPKALPTTARCVERAIAAHRLAGQVCRMPRQTVLNRDPAVVAAQRLASPRVQVVDLTRYFCDTSWCYPVVGGALVQKDWNHISSTFTATVGPYLLQDLNRLMTTWR
jgi:SGNH domain-containing protein